MVPHHDEYEIGQIGGYRRGYESGYRVGYEVARLKKAGKWFLIGWVTMASMFLIPELLK